MSVAIVVGAAYGTTLLPGVGYAGDVAKFQFVGHVLGTPHAPGYPLYVGFSHLFSKLLPIGTVAFRINLLSALFAVSTVLVLYALLRSLDCRRTVAAIVASSTGLLPAIWSQAVIAEVYTLHLLLVLATVLLLVRWQGRRHHRDLVAALAVLALGFAHHLTIVTLVPAILGFVMLVDRRAIWGRGLVSLALLPLVGILPYAYLFWRTAQTKTSYLEIQTPDLGTWLWYLTGAQFRERIFAFDPWEVVTERMPLVGRLALDQIASGRASLIAAAAVAVLAVAGALALRNGAQRILLVGILVGNVIYVLGYDIPDLAAYLAPSYAMIAIGTGVGLEHLLRRLPPSARAVVLAVLLLVPLALYGRHRPAMDRSGHRAEEVWAMEVLAAIDRDVSADSRPKIVIAGDYLTYETLQYARQIGPPDGGSPRRDLFLLTPLLPDAALPEIRAFVAQHQPPPLVREQLSSTRTPLAVRRYLAGAGDLTSFEERSTAPRGLALYALGDGQRALLERARMIALPVAPGVFRVELPSARVGEIP